MGRKKGIKNNNKNTSTLIKRVPTAQKRRRQNIVNIRIMYYIFRR